MYHQQTVSNSYPNPIVIATCLTSNLAVIMMPLVSGSCIKRSKQSMKFVALKSSPPILTHVLCPSLSMGSIAVAHRKVSGTFDHFITRDSLNPEHPVVSPFP